MEEAGSCQNDIVMTFPLKMVYKFILTSLRYMPWYKSNKAGWILLPNPRIGFVLIIKILNCI